MQAAYNCHPWTTQQNRKRKLTWVISHVTDIDAASDFRGGNPSAESLITPRVTHAAARAGLFRDTKIHTGGDNLRDRCRGKQHCAMSKSIVWHGNHGLGYAERDCKTDLQHSEDAIGGSGARLASIKYILKKRIPEIGNEATSSANPDPLHSVCTALHSHLQTAIVPQTPQNGSMWCTVLHRPPYIYAAPCSSVQFRGYLYRSA